MTMVDFDPPPGLDYYETDLFIPTYHLKNGDNGWRLQAAPLSISQGYWTPTRFVRDMVGLLRHGDTWMSTSPMEMESQEIGIRLSHGYVLICGMGMGWSAVNCALLPTVTRVTVVEAAGLHGAARDLTQQPRQFSHRRMVKTPRRQTWQIHNRHPVEKRL